MTSDFFYLRKKKSLEPGDRNNSRLKKQHERPKSQAIKSYFYSTVDEIKNKKT